MPSRIENQMKFIFFIYLFIITSKKYLQISQAYGSGCWIQWLCHSCCLNFNDNFLFVGSSDTGDICCMYILYIFTAVVDILLQQGVSIDSVDSKGCTPLIVAAQYGKIIGGIRLRFCPSQRKCPNSWGRRVFYFKFCGFDSAFSWLEGCYIMFNVLW